MLTACLDLEGVLIPEIWHNVAAALRVEELNLTTRDIPDYHKLMRYRLDILHRLGIRLPDIQAVITRMEPLPGALDFLRRLREQVAVIILSDTYVEFMQPMLPQLEWPTLVCNSLEVEADGTIRNYRLRQDNGKLHAVRAFQSMRLEVRAAGDSYNDLAMILEADRGAFFRPPASIVAENPSVPVYEEYEGLLRFLTT